MSTARSAAAIAGSCLAVLALFLAVSHAYFDATVKPIVVPFTVTPEAGEPFTCVVVKGKAYCDRPPTVTPGAPTAPAPERDTTRSV